MLSVRGKGKYTKIDPNAPRAVGRCDYSGLLVRREDMKWQLQYAGYGTYNTNLLVHPKFIDVPNPQSMAPFIVADPRPIQYPRPDDNPQDFILPPQPDPKPPF